MGGEETAEVSLEVKEIIGVYNELTLVADQALGDLKINVEGEIGEVAHGS